MKNQTYLNGRNGLDVRTALVFLVITILALSAAVYAGPQGAKVVRGKVQFTQQGDTLIIKASNNSIINFRSFSIPAGETVRFVLPSSSSRVLSRVTGGTASQIDGMLVCNGRLYLTNYAGVNFGSTAVVNAAALYAVAGNISDRDFLRKVDRFSGVSGSVTNDGLLQAQAVHLVGQQVTNSGSIIVPCGVVTMTAASGEVFLAERDGHVMVMVAATAATANTGAVAAPQSSAGATNPLAVGDMYSLAVQNTGTVKAREVAIGGAGAKVDVSGKIDAANPTGRGGDVRITGQQISIAGAAIDASGATGGGEIQIFATAADAGRFAKASVYISADSIISASAGLRGNGGRITVKADDLAVVNGLLVARGGPNGGAGGYVETSGGVLSVTQAPDVSAAKGRGGTWLIDPHDIEIVDTPLWSLDTAADNGYDVTNFGKLTISPMTGSPTVTQLPLNVILAGMKRAETVIVQTSPGGDGKGDITWTMSSERLLNMNTLRTDDVPGDFRRLVLRANNNINIDFYNLIRVEQGSIQLVLEPNYDHRGGGHVYSVVYGSGNPAKQISVTPDTSNMSMRDVSIIQVASPVMPTPPNNADVPEPSKGEADRADQNDNIEKNQDLSNTDHIELIAAESGAMGETKIASIRRSSQVTSQPSITAGDAVGIRIDSSRIPK